ncbi:hypothetical protein NQ315_015550 [Exocentrus adspersus]|uniref:C2H2-type domain-containing protein n=1 Tax=Exocentrus adspersus TaxID=1586481 RepID=A0AAV8V5Z4_9CUCU|nr:hypothetical protein NQ315_015550 [Exocentrus adspersus]
MSPIRKSREIKTKKRDNKKSYICVVCCKTCSKKRNFEETGEVTNEILDMLLLERDQTPVEDPVMCLKCFQKVNIIFEFKAACLYVEDFITPFVDTEERNRIDLKEVYIRKNDNKDLIFALLGRDLCRLCMSVVDNGCFYLDSSELHVKLVKEMIKRCIPEINVNNTRNAIVCGTCVGCLIDFCNFMESYSESRSSSRITRVESLNVIVRNITDIMYRKENTYVGVAPVVISSVLVPKQQEGHWKPMAILNLVLCLIEQAKDKGCLNKHMLVHKKPSEIEWFKCHSCNFKTKRKHALKTHTLIHKDPSEIEWFKCDLCDYKTKHKSDLNQHSTDTSEIEWFQCELCDYKGKRKRDLTNHRVIHQNSWEIKWFECHFCDYKGKHKRCLTKHMFIHKDTSDIEWFECHLCDYKTKRKVLLKNHMLIHKNPSEIEWFKCVGKTPPNPRSGMDTGEEVIKTKSTQGVLQNVGATDHEDPLLRAAVDYVPDQAATHRRPRQQLLDPGKVKMSPIKKCREVKTKQRDIKKSYICVVCCKTCSKRNFQETGEVTNEILDILLLVRDQTRVEGPVMCLKCSEKVNIIFEFKSACLYVEDFITPFVNTGNRIDLKEVYIRKKGNRDLMFALLGRDLCRLCMSVVDNGCAYLDSTELHVKFVKEMIKQCIPEINVNNTRNAIVCGTCVGCLIDFCSFMERYSQNRLSSRSQTTGRSLEADTEPGPMPNRASTSILIEGVGPVGRESSSQIYQSDFCDYQSKLKYRMTSHIRSIHKNPLKIKWFECSLCDYKSKRKNDLNRHIMVIHKKPSEIEWFKCHLCNFKTKHKNNLKTHTLIHKGPSEIEWFKCDLCDFKTKHKSAVNMHKEIHKNSWEIKWFECHFCDYKAKRKGYLNKHIMCIHKDPSEIEWFECHLCDYKSKQKVHLKTHTLIHKNPSEIEWYECHLCDYKAKCKNHLSKHMVIHKKPSEIEWFKCHLCNFKTKHKNNLKTHTLIHKGPSEIEWFKCDLCDYKSKQKVHLKTHTLIHKNPSEIEWYECHLCDYKAKCKNHLSKHMVIHKKPSEIEWFKCHLCNFKTKHKNNLKTHTLIHKGPSEIEWSKCDLCDFKTKHKSAVNMHKEIHKNSWEIKWFECHFCDYKTKRKGYLNKHIMCIHKDPSEIEWFECHLCDYKSKQKVHLKTHTLIHKNPSEIEWYECHLCDYKAKRKRYLKTHTLIHKKISEIEWFECDSCNFKSKHKRSFNKHVKLAHRSR